VKPDLVESRRVEKKTKKKTRRREENNEKTRRRREDEKYNTACTGFQPVRGRSEKIYWNEER